MSVQICEASVFTALAAGLGAALTTAADSIADDGDGYALSWVTDGVTPVVEIRSEEDERIIDPQSLPFVTIWFKDEAPQTDWMAKPTDLDIPVKITLIHHEKNAPDDSALATLWTLRCIDWAWLPVARAITGVWDAWTITKREIQYDVGADRDRRIAIVAGMIKCRTTRSA